MDCRSESISLTGKFIDNMSLPKPLKKLASCVILDLDGTLLNTGQHTLNFVCNFILFLITFFIIMLVGFFFIRVLIVRLARQSKIYVAC